MSVGSAFSTGHCRTPLALVGHARGRRRVSVQAISRAAGDVAYSLPSRSWIPSGTEMALHCNADMVRAIVGALQIKFLSSLAGSQS